MDRTGKKYEWFVIGDINGFFGLMFDNLTVLSFLAGVLVFGFKFPADIVYSRMFPGTAIGVLFGDMVYTWMAFRLARKTGNTSVTAMPLGLDTPSTIGMALVVLGPAFLGLKAEEMPEREAAILTWQIGMATVVMMGALKLVLSFCGGWVQKIVPQAGLLGSLAGVGLALIGFIPLADIFGMPIVGLVALGLILYTLIAGLAAAAFPGSAGQCPDRNGPVLPAWPDGMGRRQLCCSPPLALHMSFPVPNLGFIHGFGPGPEVPADCRSVCHLDGCRRD